MTQYISVEVKITQYLEIVLIQHDMFPYTVIAEEIATYSLLFNIRSNYHGYQHICQKIDLVFELMAHL